MLRKKLSYYITRRKGAKSKTLTLRPGRGRAVGLGYYETKTPVPNLKVTYHPNLGDEMAVAHEKFQLPGGSKYELLYQFHNYSSKTCKITIQLMQSMK